MVKRKKRWRKSSPRPILARAAIEGLLERMGGSRGRSQLCGLWAHWEEILGPELAEMARPLGSHKEILLIGANDAMQMQELHFMANEILVAVNGFLQCEYFREVRISLFGMAARQVAKKNRVAVPVLKKKENISAPRPSGKYLAGMDKASPVAQCYARFALKRI